MAGSALSETDIDAARLAVRLRAVTKIYDNGVTALGPLLMALLLNEQLWFKRLIELTPKPTAPRR